MTALKCSACLISLLLPAMAHSFVPIRGAFGVDLGAQVDATAITRDPADKPAPEGIDFSPPEPRAGLEEYFLVASPLTQRVYAIIGRGDVPSLSGCLKERRRIAGEMERVHGEPETQENAITAVFGSDPSLVGRQGDRTIRVECDVGQGGSRLTLEYRDEALAAEAMAERAALEEEERRAAASR